MYVKKYNSAPKKMELGLELMRFFLKLGYIKSPLYIYPLRCLSWQQYMYSMNPNPPCQGSTHLFVFLWSKDKLLSWYLCFHILSFVLNWGDTA